MNDPRIERDPALDIGGYTNDEVTSMLEEVNRLYLIPTACLSEMGHMRIDQLEGALEDAGIHK